MIEIIINGEPCQAEQGATVLETARSGGTYIPTLCSHPDLPPFGGLPLASRIFRGDSCHENQAIDEQALHDMQGCGLCAVEVDGLTEPIRACKTIVSEGMSVQTDTTALEEIRRRRLAKVLARHPHACITCAQREGCSLEDCSSNVPKEERCCSQFHHCELRKVADHVGVSEQTPRYRPAGLPVLTDEPLFARDFNLCIDCARCVRVCNDVRSVDALGLVHRDDRLIVGSVGPTLTDSACKFCGACVEVCPTGCLTDKDAPAGDREQWLVPCVQTCPADVDVPGYIRCVANNDLAGAAAVVWEKLPLANTLGHICFHDCEIECRRTQIDDPVAICALKRFALTAGDGMPLLEEAMQTATGKRVAVIGAGPAGLSAAFYLRLKGHDVTVFEASESAGGMPAICVPDHRLPQTVLEKDIAAIERFGVEIKTGCRLSTRESFAELHDEGFDAQLIAVGLARSKKIDIEGGDLNGVQWGLEFLTNVKAGQRAELGKEVVVIGGGNVAIDVAMTALRVSRGIVRLYCLEGRDEMPASSHEIEKAQAEGIEINPGWGPVAIRDAAGKVGSVEFQRCIAVLDEKRSFAPTFDEHKRTTVNADAVILAVGQSPAEDIPAEQDGVFLAGDIEGVGTSGGSVVHAVASGRAAGERIDRYLGGNGDVSVKLGDRPKADARIGREEGFAPRGRVAIPCETPADRCYDSRPIEGTYSPDAALSEAKRCLQCDLRLMIHSPVLPPERWQAFDRMNVEKVPPVEGVFSLADAQKKPIAIKGTADIRAGLLEKLESETEASFFLWEEDRMYTKRESELIQQHLTQFGELPGGGDDELDDLF